MISPAWILSFEITSSLFILAHTVESTTTVLTKSPRSAVSPPVLVIPTPHSRIVFNTSSVPSIRFVKTSPVINPLFLPMVDDNNISSAHPMHNKSSVFITTESCAMPLHTFKSPVSFQYAYASDDFVPAPSAWTHVQYSGSIAIS